jgi:hypothetical protein
MPEPGTNAGLVTYQDNKVISFTEGLDLWESALLNDDTDRPARWRVYRVINDELFVVDPGSPSAPAL